MTSTERFDILSYRGVEIEIQRLFSKYASQHRNGQITFDFFDREGRFIDNEILSLHRVKQSSFGISQWNLSENIRSVFISDSYASMICFASQFKSRISFDEASFIIIGANFDHELLASSFQNIPKTAKINTVFSASILGRIMDCQVENIIQKRDCSFTLSKNKVLLKDKSKERFREVSIHDFALWKYCKAMGMNQYVKTYKPKKDGIESFYQLNQLYWNDPN